jgi:hypothetical protein
MKKTTITTIIITILLLFPVLCLASTSESLKAVIAKKNTASNFCDTKTGYLLCEDMQGSTACVTDGETVCRNTWTARGACAAAPDWTYATPLSGTNSFYVDENANASNCSFQVAVASTSSVYAYYTFKYGTLSGIDNAGEQLSTFCLDDTYCCAVIGWDGDSIQFGVKVGTTYNWGSTTTPTAGTQYHAWLEHVRNDSCSLYISANTTKPGSVEAQDATGTNFAVDLVYFDAYDFAYDIDALAIDNILIDDAVLGNQ